MTSESVILRWTGHPLIDVGVAALTAFAGKRDPATVSAADLERFVEFAERNYLSADLSKTVGILFTMNSFLNPSLKPEQRRARIRDAVSAFARAGDDSLPPCTYCGRPALRVLHRDDLPMILGRTVVNFYPGGVPGLAICGACQLALHGLTLGAPRCAGKALVLYADDPAFMLDVVRQWVQRTRKYAELSAQGETPPAFSAPRTRVVEALLRAQGEAEYEERPIGLVAYHISNSGQGPGIDIYPLPSTVVQFLMRARAARYRDAWSAIERRAWQRLGKRGGSAADLDDEERGEYRNFLYEDLFRLPEDAARFIRLYFLRNPGGLVRRTDIDPRADYGTAAELDVISWNLVDLFLKEVMGMNQARIDAIRTLGDRLAEEISANNDKPLLRTAYLARGYVTVRRLLLQISHRRLNRQDAPVVGFDEFLTIFEEGEELARADWRLAWDLTLIRLIERLHELGQDALLKDAVSAEEVAQQEEEEREAAAI